MSTPQTEPFEVATRRAKLRQWITDKFDGSQVKFLNDCAARQHEINQGELSGLLKAKSFGEKKARTIEVMAGMPPYYLNGKSVEYETANHVVNSPSHYQPAAWPFARPSSSEWAQILSPKDREAVEAMAATLLDARMAATNHLAPATNTTQTGSAA